MRRPGSRPARLRRAVAGALRRGDSSGWSVRATCSPTTSPTRTWRCSRPSSGAATSSRATWSARPSGSSCAIEIAEALGCRRGARPRRFMHEAPRRADARTTARRASRSSSRRSCSRWSTTYECARRRSTSTSPTACSAATGYEEALGYLSRALDARAPPRLAPDEWAMLAETTYPLYMLGRWDEALAAPRRSPRSMLRTDGHAEPAQLGGRDPRPRGELARGGASSTLLALSRDVGGRPGAARRPSARGLRFSAAKGARAEALDAGRALAPCLRGACRDLVPAVTKQVLRAAVEAAFALGDSEQAEELLAHVEALPPGSGRRTSRRRRTRSARGCERRADRAALRRPRAAARSASSACRSGSPSRSSSTASCSAASDGRAAACRGAGDLRAARRDAVARARAAQVAAGGGARRDLPELRRREPRPGASSAASAARRSRSPARRAAPRTGRARGSAASAARRSARLRAPAAAAAPTAAAAERRLVSVLFADLVGFTAASEGRDAEEMRELLSRYFDTCAAR